MLLLYKKKKSKWLVACLNDAKYDISCTYVRLSGHYDLHRQWSDNTLMYFIPCRNRFLNDTGLLNCLAKDHFEVIYTNQSVL